MEFHISRFIREKLALDDVLFSYTGNIVFANVAASRKLAQQLNELREKESAGTPLDPSRVVHAGALFAMGLIDELAHALVAQYRKTIDPNVLLEAVRWFASQSDPKQLDRLLLTFTEQFPSVAVYRGELTASQWLTGSTDGLSNREAALEELMLLWIANINPAFKAFGELFEDGKLKQQTIYTNVTAALPGYFATRPLFAPEIGSLIDALRAPFLASPDSLTGQLDYIREHWAKHLGEDLRRVLLAIDTLREEDLAIWMQFNPPAPDWYRHGQPGSGGEGFVGDEYIGFDDQYIIGPDGKRKLRYDKDYQAPLNEYEAFSADQAWMPTVVLMAKSTYVWLEQLSKKYGRHIHRLDHIPDEELRLLSERGITGLWLIGLWERSVASRTIKRLRGHHDAVASAYSLKDYQIAEDLGGNYAYEHLRERAAAFGLRLASDMVPNHMGIDSPWVIEHPDWFIHRWESPFPAYSFNGPDLSTDSRVEIKIDDHYYDQTDAAVAFRLRTHADGSTRYIYHGNDGTTFAWNDTAQLDYSKAYVREHVMQVILHVARLFPIIRFDAAMVLAKRHVQRLWFPLPGAGGSIPSRAENAMSQEEFDALMPLEFWREVVDRVAVEVPGTLLLAEAFWMLEGYFVRTLGMHRVYNSAFMNMLRDEENAKYRSYLKKTIEFDPDILKRYVNFMSNPDERTAIDQFGSEDKYFGVATLMSTLPGLPMFGHGQIEGYTERYGMEYKTAKMDERPNEHLVARHMREIAPLLKNRHIFAESTHFVLYDFWTGYGTVNENVFAYSNRHDGQRAVILYNNSYGSTEGNLHTSVGHMDKGSGELRQRQLAEGLALPWDESVIIRYRDSASGLEYLHRSSEVHRQGLNFSLRGYQYIVLLDWRDLHSTAEWPWDRLCDELQGTGVPNLDDALLHMRLRPLHAALREALSQTNLAAFTKASKVGSSHSLATTPATRLSEVVITPDHVSELPTNPDSRTRASEEPHALEPVSSNNIPGATGLGTPSSTRTLGAARVGIKQSSTALLNPTPISTGKTLTDPTLEPFLTIGELFFTQIPADLVPKHSTSAKTFSDSLEANTQAATHLTFNTLAEAAPILAYTLFCSLPWSNKAALFDRLQLRTTLGEIFQSLGLPGEDAWRAAARVRILLAQYDQPTSPLTELFWTDPDVRWLAGVNDSSGNTYFNKEAFEELLHWLQLPKLLERAIKSDPTVEIESLVTSVSTKAKAAGYDLQLFLTPVVATAKR
jgi:glycosidase